MNDEMYERIKVLYANLTLLPLPSIPDDVDIAELIRKGIEGS